jgi:hypothetical protein
VDSFSGPGILYLVAIGPGLLLALVDWLFTKTRAPGFIGTTLLVYVGSVLYLAWDDSAQYIFALGLIGAIPAAVCSWLSRNR